MLNSRGYYQIYCENYNKDLLPNYECENVLTLDFRAVGRAFGVPSWLIKVFCDSISKEGNKGVPGGVRSLKQKNISTDTIIRDSYMHYSTPKKKCYIHLISSKKVHCETKSYISKINK